MQSEINSKYNSNYAKGYILDLNLHQEILKKIYQI